MWLDDEPDPEPRGRPGGDEDEAAGADMGARAAAEANERAIRLLGLTEADLS